jgi:hypothetical protein
MSDEENEVPEEETPAEEPVEEPPAAPSPAPPAPSPKPAPPTPTPSTGGGGGGEGDVPKYQIRKAKPRDQAYSAGRPSKFTKEKLLASDGIIPLQSGSNKFASQRGMTGFGVPRDVVDKIHSPNLAEITDEVKIGKCKEILRLQSGSNKYASQKGQSGFGAIRDVMYKPKGTGGASEVDEAKQQQTQGIVILQSGTNKLASQKGMTGMGMPRGVYDKKMADQDKRSEGFIQRQMSTHIYASQAGMTGFGMPRHNISKYKDEARGEMPHDETSLSRQTSGYKEGASQQGMSAFSAFRNTTVSALQEQVRTSQGFIPYQMGINWADSQAGKTGFGMPRNVFTLYVDDTRPELPESLAMAPDVPFWSGQEQDYANQVGMTAIGMPRDVNGHYVRRLW